MSAHVIKQLDEAATCRLMLWVLPGNVSQHVVLG
jgi:hypothetical protein